MHLGISVGKQEKSINYRWLMGDLRFKLIFDKKKKKREINDITEIFSEKMVGGSPKM